MGNREKESERERERESAAEKEIGAHLLAKKQKQKIFSQVGFFTSDKTLIGPETLECVQKASVSQDWFFSEWREYYFQMASWGVDQSVLKGIPASAVG